MRLVPRLLALTLLGATAPLAAQTVRGRMVDAESGAPLAGGTLVLLEERSEVARAETDSLGRFVITAREEGEYRVQGDHPGHRPATSPTLILAHRDTMEVEFRLSRRIVLLDPLVVTAPARRVPALLRGYYDRLSGRTATGGRFITRAQVERLHPSQTSDLLRRLPGIRVVPGGFGRGSTLLLRECVPRLYVDGQSVRTNNIGIDELVAPMDIEGIEIYGHPSEVPLELSGANTTCGAIVVWTRRR